MRTVWQWRVRCLEEGRAYYVHTNAGAPTPTECPIDSTHAVRVSLATVLEPRTDYSGLLAVPGANADRSQGWFRGSRILASDGDIYECVADGNGAAVWLVATDPSFDGAAGALTWMRW